MKYGRITFQERKVIEKMLKEGKNIEEIAKEIGVHRSTIYTEIRRCPAREYDAQTAQNTL